MNPQARTYWIASTLACLSILSACGGGGGGGYSSTSTTPPPQQMGTVTVGLTDAPACGFDSVWVTVTKVRINQSSTATDTDSGWTDIVLPANRKINLLSLSNGVLDRLGQAQLPAGSYNQVRLVLADNTSLSPMSNSVVPTGKTEQPLDTPSATQSGIKINQSFDVAAGATVDLALDFDACKSVVVKGNGGYALKPVISAVQLLVSGSISGVIDASVANSHPLITAQQNGVVIKATVPDATGKFSLSPITAGSYEVVATADARATSIISGVPVTAKTDTVISTSNSPLAMPAATTNNLTGTVLPITAAADTRVSQSIPNGPTVQIVAKPVDVNTGAYTFALPSSPPMVGKYTTGFTPLSMLGEVGAAGKYTIEASAVGYKTQSAAVDVSLFNIIKDFTLVP